MIDQITMQIAEGKKKYGVHKMCYKKTKKVFLCNEKNDWSDNMSILVSCVSAAPNKLYIIDKGIQYLFKINHG